VNDTQDAFDAAVQAQPASELTVTDPLAPLEPAFTDAGEIENAQLAPPCWTVKVLSATVSVPVRGEVDVFAAAE